MKEVTVIWKYTLRNWPIPAKFSNEHRYLLKRFRDFPLHSADQLPPTLSQWQVLGIVTPVGRSGAPGGCYLPPSVRSFIDRGKRAGENGPNLGRYVTTLRRPGSESVSRTGQDEQDVPRRPADVIDGREGATVLGEARDELLAEAPEWNTSFKQRTRENNKYYIVQEQHIGKNNGI